MPWAAFEILLRALAKRAGARPTVEQIRATPWSSMNFCGRRFCFALWFEGHGGGARATRLAAGLDYAEFDLGNHILADILVANQTISPAGATIEIEALILAKE